jgi:hypothetical protein
MHEEEEDDDDDLCAACHTNRCCKECGDSPLCPSCEKWLAQELREAESLEKQITPNAPCDNCHLREKKLLLTWLTIGVNLKLCEDCAWEVGFKSPQKAWG